MESRYADAKQSSRKRNANAIEDNGEVSDTDAFEDGDNEERGTQLETAIKMKKTIRTLLVAKHSYA